MSLPEPRVRALDACPVCRSPASRERFTSPDLLLGVPGSFRYVECEKCRTVYQNPRVRDEDLALCYPTDYYTHGRSQWTPNPAPPGSLRDRLRRAIRAAADRVPDEGLPPGLRLAGWLLACVPGVRRRARRGLVDGLELPPGGGGRCLEVGPGLGVDLFCLRSLGWEAFGLEVDPRAAEQARATSGCEVRVGTLAATDYPTASFDLVYMNHVFEHLPDPGPTLTRSFELLKAGGRLVLVHPNPAALTARWYGRDSPVWEPPRHLVLPSPGAVAALAARSGFAEPRVSTMTRHAAVYSEAARQRGRGNTWDMRRPQRPRLVARGFGLAETLLASVGWPVGEEIVLRARKPRGLS